MTLLIPLAQAPLPPDAGPNAAVFIGIGFVPWLIAGVVLLLIVMRMASAISGLLEGKPGSPRWLRGEAKRLAGRGEHYRAGDLYRSAGDLDQAVEQYRVAGFLNKSADVQAGRGNHDAAATLYERSQMWEAAADAYRRAGQLKKAEQCYLKAGKKLVVARMLDDAGEHLRAAALYKETGKLDRAADLMERHGKPGEAAELVEKLYFNAVAGVSVGKSSTTKEDAQRIEERAVALYKQADKLDKALDFYVRAGLYPKAAELCLEIGQADRAVELFMKAGKEDRAASLFEAQGESLKAARLRGDLALREGQLFSAARHYEEAGEPRLAADVYEKLGENSRAATTYEKAGDYAQAAYFYAKTGDLETAARLYDQVGDLESALRCYEQLKDAPRRASILMRAGKFCRAGSEYLRMGRVDDAIAALQKVEPASGDSAMAFSLLGTAFLEKGLPRVALEKLDLALSIPPIAGGPSRLECLFDRARALEDMGELETALLAYEKVVAIDATFRDGASRLASLKARLPAAIAISVAGAMREGPKTEVIAARQHGSGERKAVGMPESGVIDMKPAGVRASGRLPGQSPPKHTIEPGSGGSGGKSSEALTQGPASLQHGRYRIMEEIGRGGMGVVYKCHDTLLDRIVAYKVLSSQIRDFPAALENFLREAKSAARLHHPNVVTLFDFGEGDGGGYFMTLEYVSGKNLRQFMKGGPEKEMIRRVLIGICEGLAYAHSQSVIHRDIKPSNILISDVTQQSKILDFGLAKIVEDVSATASGVLGTPWYMSPEQVLGVSVSHQSDLYSFGVTLFEVLTGELPFKGRDFGYHHVHTMPPSPRSVNPARVSADVDKIILRCMEKKAEDRFTSAHELAEAVRSAAL